MNRSELKDACCRGNQKLAQTGLVLYTFGNLSVADHAAGEFAIKPSGVPYAELTPEKIVILDFAGERCEGDWLASSDAPTHAALYRHCPDIGSILHTHSPYATAWAQACRPIPVLGTTHADLAADAIPCTAIMPAGLVAGDYEANTGQWIIQTLAGLNLAAAAIPMILVGGHGPFAWGRDAEAALYHGVMLETLAQMAMFTLQVAPDTQPLPAYLINRHFQRKHGAGAYYGQPKKEKQ
jgi:L-ribulose-5-phosphate 4-epimerase